MTLPDLSQILADVRAQEARIRTLSDRLILPQDVRDGISAIWHHPVVIKDGEVDFITSEDTGATITVVNANILRAAVAVPLYRAMSEYKSRVLRIKDEIGFSDAYFNKLFKDKKSATNPPERWKEWKKRIDAQPDLDKADKQHLESFIINPNSLTSHKGIARGDWYAPALLKAVGLRVDHHGIIADISERMSEHQTLYESVLSLLDNPTLAVASQPVANGGKNIIIYGAPGTGKSFSLKGLPNIVRTVFHNEYRNSDFVGSYKPYKVINDDGSEDITYKFVPGPFIVAFINALKKSEEQHNLIIEEINRANAGAAFGEIFQLLDRSEGGESEYSIDVEQSVSDYLRDQLGELWRGKLYIPSNLSLRASMNSADQGVEPMDSAFKRRWEFQYLPIIFENSEPSSITEIIPYKDNFYSWRTFATAINAILIEQGVEEDRLLGPHFLSRRELLDTSNIVGSISGKVFIYLWDDVLRHGGRGWIFNTDEYKTFFDVARAYQDKKGVFAEQLEEKLLQIHNATTATNAVEASAEQRVEAHEAEADVG